MDRPRVVLGPPAGNTYDLGSELKDVFEHSTRRIAVVASGDLSHSLSSACAAWIQARRRGVRPQGRRGREGHLHFESVIDGHRARGRRERLHSRANPDFVWTSERKKARVEILSYEHPFGVGYLVAQPRMIAEVLAHFCGFPSQTRVRPSGAFKAQGSAGVIRANPLS